MRFERRGLLHCAINVPGLPKAIHCVCAHLSVFARSRRRQLDALAARRLYDGKPAGRHNLLHHRRQICPGRRPGSVGRVRKQQSIAPTLAGVSQQRSGDDHPQSDVLERPHGADNNGVAMPLDEFLDLAVDRRERVIAVRPPVPLP